MLTYDGRLKEVSRQPRKKTTDAERLFWSTVKLKQLGSARFYRQKIIGNRIVGFYCPHAKLVVEIDGLSNMKRREPRTMPLGMAA